MAVFFVVFLFPAGFAYPAPRISPEPFFLSIGEAIEPLPLDMLIDASLRASGSEDPEASVDTIHRLIEKLQGEIAGERDERQKAEYVLTFLHDNLFVLYDEYQTEIDQTLTDGTFNCVSSAVLYMIFSRSVGLRVTGISTRDHAFCSVLLPGARVDVETTTVYGFEPGKKKEFQDAFGNVTGFSYVPPSNYAARRELSERELIALILQNRISLLETQKRYDEALELAVDRFAMAPNDLTEDHLYRGAINYAALLNERREYKDAIEFLSRFVDTYGSSESVRDIYGILHYNQVVTLIRADAFTEAIDTMNELEAPGWIKADVLRDLRSQVAERILAKELPVLTSDEGFQLLSGLRDDGLLSPERYIDFAVMLVSTEADALASAGEYLAAAAIIENAMQTFGQDRRLEKARAAYRYNFAVDAHNAFAQTFNEGRYDEAKALLEEASKKAPDSDLLRRDMMLLEKQLSGSN